MSPTRPAVAADDHPETPAQRLNRNWESLLQEMRVTQTGAQIIAGFLLAVAFQQRFEELDAYQLTVYLVLVCLAALTTVLALGPVSLHRLPFRRHAMSQIVRIGSRLVRATLAGVALVVSGTVLLIFDVVLSRSAGIVAGCVMLVVTTLVWVVLPRLVRPPVVA